MPATGTDAHALPREIMIRPRALSPIRHDTFAIYGQDCVHQGPGQHQSCTRARARAANCRTHRLACLKTPTFWSCLLCFCFQRSSHDDSTGLTRYRTLAVFVRMRACTDVPISLHRRKGCLLQRLVEQSSLPFSQGLRVGQTSWDEQTSQFVRAVPRMAAWQCSIPYLPSHAPLESAREKVWKLPNPGF